MSTKSKEMNSRNKIAIFLMFLGPDLSREIVKLLSEEEMETIAVEIARIRRVDQEDRDAVVEDFYNMVKAQEFITSGGVSAARDFLRAAVGDESAENIISKLTSSLEVQPFDLIRAADPEHLKNFISGEHPQTIALILAYLASDKAAIILSSFNAETQVEVAKRLAMMDRTSPEIVRDVESILEKKLSSVSQTDYASVGGVDSLVDIINQVDRGTEKAIIENLEIQNPDLAEEIKKRMFVFEDLNMLDDRGMQRVLKEVDSKDLGLALKSASEDVKKKFLKNMSKRASQMLQDEMAFMGPVRIKDVEEAQQKIVNVVRGLEENGEIVVSRGGEDELVT
ncbi:MAG: flagellar motor switch protein FliG [Candidatus Cloacimonadota bacterium]|nr:MAG: flagellar motor switch protein FliG [Candidatus Cloacimonadota bacterium]